uniref:CHROMODOMAIN HELICASE DNA BINDING putative n=1 Tax=Albugo laibachii Nc14 TaxID=890382 RepID=F0W3C9_9STRA|nr:CHROMODOMAIN HELICASE DNA BINDING putative [Albugo laibachii Nc14]|eukprot:CCA15572.1 CHROMODOMAIN HELICASE DNA BINDING putative [Albugo laibachii Nc14]
MSVNESESISSFRKKLDLRAPTYRRSQRNTRSNVPCIHEISDGEHSEHNAMKQEKSDDEYASNEDEMEQDSEAEQHSRRTLRSGKRSDQGKSRREGVQTRQRIRSNISGSDHQLSIDSESEAETQPPQKKLQHSDSTEDEDEDEENAFIIDKILACDTHTTTEWNELCDRRTTRFLQQGSIFVRDDEETTRASKRQKVGSTGEKQLENETKYLVKWKNLSYLHVSWELERRLVDYEKNARGKILRFHEKLSSGSNMQGSYGDELFNPEHCVVDRVLEIRKEPEDEFSLGEEADEVPETEESQYLLIKWKALPYDEITWERKSDVKDDEAVRAFLRRSDHAIRRYKKSKLLSSKSFSTHQKIKFRGYSATNPPPFKSVSPYLDESESSVPNERNESNVLELRDYQLTGVNWMLFNWYHSRNSMLADEMGLGKTVQTVTFINHLATTEGLPGPYLIIAPLSTLAHWQREFSNWCCLNAVVYHGTYEARKLIEKHEFYLTAKEFGDAMLSMGKFWGDSKKTRKRRRTLEKSLVREKADRISVPAGARTPRQFIRFDVLITTFEMLGASDSHRLSRIDWQVVVVDEAHRLKNFNSKSANIMRKSIKYQNILLLTGTPLQNNVEELWTLLHLLDRGRFRSKEAFLEEYGDLKEHSQVEKLHADLKPYLLRRLKEDVEASLAPKEETIIEVELTVLQKQYYRAIYERNVAFLIRGGRRADGPSLMNVMMELRKCCNHPFLIKGVEQREIERLEKQEGIPLHQKEAQARELLVTSSGKLILLDKLLPLLEKGGHRVLIFSQFKIMLDILQDYLSLRGFKFERIDGNITGNERQAAIDRYCGTSNQAFVMLISTRAGGVGINLTAADTVIIYDSDWNPQNDLQAQARCHRIGQTKSVKIYRLLTSKTYELQMFHQASIKLGLDQVVLGGMQDTSDNSASKQKKIVGKKTSGMSKDEIENLLKYGAYDIFNELKDGHAEAASKRFGEESIHKILERSTRIIHDPNANAKDGKRKLMSSFSKATFMSSSNTNEEVDINDPDFWTKVIGSSGSNFAEGSEVDTMTLERGERQCRKKLKSYIVDVDQAVLPPAEANNGDEEYTNSHSSSESSESDVELAEKPSSSPQEELYGGVRFSKFLEVLSTELFTFGYNRWSAMQKAQPILGRVGLERLRKLAGQYISTCIRLASREFVEKLLAMWKLKEQEPSEKQSIPSPIDSLKTKKNAILNSVQLDTLENEIQVIEAGINAFGSQFAFLGNVLKDAQVNRITQIERLEGAFTVLKETGNVSNNTEKEVIVSLNHYERLHQLQVIVHRDIFPLVPMIALLQQFQRISDPHLVEDCISRCYLPSVPNSGESETIVNGCLTLMENKIQLDSSANGSDVPHSTSMDGVQASASTDSEAQLKALKQLRQFRGIGTGVCPWWTPVVDDVMLLLYFYIHGWKRANKVTIHDILTSPLFHYRTSKHPADTWPYMLVLLRRARSLVSLWERERKVIQTKPSPPPIPSLPTASSLTSSSPTNEVSAQGPGDLRKMQNSFAKIVFSIGIPDTTYCSGEVSRQEKWRYFLHDPVLGRVTRNIRVLEQEAYRMDQFCRHKTKNQEFVQSGTLIDMKGEWALSPIQCSRLVDRIDLFRSLRKKILLLAPKHLLSIALRAVSRIRHKGAIKYPTWWSTPTHDATLLQGVEYHGLGVQFVNVWGFPAFAKFKQTAAFPQLTWVENYTRELVEACCQVLDLIQANNPAQTSQVQDPKSAGAGRLRRANDIQKMRLEDPQVVEHVKARKSADTSEFAWKDTQKRSVESVSTIDPVRADLSGIAKTEVAPEGQNQSLANILSCHRESGRRPQSSTDSEAGADEVPQVIEQEGAVCDANEPEAQHSNSEERIGRVKYLKLETSKSKLSSTTDNNPANIESPRQPLSDQIIIIDDSDEEGGRS